MRPMRSGENKGGLRQLIEYLPDNMDMVEVGTYAGEAAEYFSKKMSLVWCIDCWEGYAEDAEAEFDKVARKYPNIVKIKDRSENVDLEPVDFVYIDGEHDYDTVKRDIEQWRPKAKRYIGGHDYKEKFPGVIQAVDEVFGKPDKVFQDSSWLCIL